MIEPNDNLGPTEGYHSPQVDVSVRLNTNESPYEPPPEFFAALHEELARVEFHRYPDREAGALRAAIGELHGLGPESVLAANGSNEVLQTICLTYGGAGRRAAVFEPTYAMHAQIARVTGTAIVEGERGRDFRLDLEEVKRVVADATPDITFVCSPNNPTGQAESPATVRAVIEMAPGLVVVDEAYGQFSRWSATELIAAGTPLVVVRTYSKTWAMAAARLGYLVGPPDVVAELSKRLLPYHLDTVKQIAGRVALRFRREMEARVATLVEERGRVATALADLEVDSWPSDANFILFRPRRHDAQEVWQALVERSVLVRDWSHWPRLEGCLRVTVGTPAENDKFITALTEILDQ